MLALAVPFVAAFVFVGVSAFQQRNVQHARYLTMFLTTLVRAHLEAVVVLAYVAQGGFHWPTVAAIGIGGGTGCAFGVWLSKRVFHD